MWLGRVQHCNLPAFESAGVVLPVWSTIFDPLSKEVSKSNFRQFEKQRWEESEKRREEERRSEKRKSQKMSEERGCRCEKVQSRDPLSFSFGAPEGRKVSPKRRVRSHLARWEMTNCTPLWRKADFEVKKLKTTHVRSAFGSCPKDQARQFRA